MEILFATYITKKMGTSPRSDIAWIYLGNLASAIDYVLLQHVRCSNTVYSSSDWIMYWDRNFFLMGIHEDEKHMGAGNFTFFT